VFFTAMHSDGVQNVICREPGRLFVTSSAGWDVSEFLIGKVPLRLDLLLVWTDPTK
jgi:hypothetical protein